MERMTHGVLITQTPVYGFCRTDHAGGLYDFGVISRKKF
jgi:hypothetical protein